MSWCGIAYTKTTRAVFFAEGGACCFLCSGPKMGITDFPCRRCRGSHRSLYGYGNLFVRLFLLLGGLMGGRSRRRCDRLSVTVALDGSCQHQRLAGAHRADHLIQHRGRENDRAEERPGLRRENALRQHRKADAHARLRNERQSKIASNLRRAARHARS